MMKKSHRILALLSAIFCSTAFFACSDNSSDEIGPTAGGVTDIGNSIASGYVYDINGNTVPSARVVAYVDSWEKSSIQDSVVTSTDASGKYELSLDSATGYILFASSGEDCGLLNSTRADAEQSQDISIGPRKKYSGQILDRHSGTVRIVGTNYTTKLDDDGNFIFDDMPQGDITIVYTDEGFDGKFNARADFTTAGDRHEYDLPKMNLSEQDSSWLTVNDGDYYHNDGYDGIHFYQPMSNNWTPPPERHPVLAFLPMDGSEIVFDDDTTISTSPNYVKGFINTGIQLRPGQFIEIDTLDVFQSDFTISLWTKWMGPNGEHQILVSERSYWSDSTSRFQWHFDNTNGWFTVMKSTPNSLNAVAFGDSTSIPVGEWSNVVLVNRNHMVSMYVNGKVLSTTDEQGNIISEHEFHPNDLSHSVPFRIGGNEVSTETWNGIIDEVRIEAGAQNADEIQRQYERSRRDTESRPQH